MKRGRATLILIISHSGREDDMRREAQWRDAWKADRAGGREDNTETEAKQYRRMNMKQLEMGGEWVKVWDRSIPWYAIVE